METCVQCGGEISRFYEASEGRYCSDNCAAKYAQHAQDRFYGAECRRCGQIRSEHAKKTVNKWPLYICPDRELADFEDGFGCKPYEHEFGSAMPKSYETPLAPFFSDQERGEMYREEALEEEIELGRG